MKKDQYILNSLYKIKHKDWELFVISRIVHSLLEKDGDIEFVCQQLVRRPEGKRALVDLYFPQFKIFLEIDEPHHESDENRANDRKRTDDIVSTAGLIERRIKIIDKDTETEKSIEAVAEEIDAFIEEIKFLKQSYIAKGKFEPWDFEGRYDPEQHIQRGFLSISTNPIFKYQHDALRCFGYTKGAYQRGAWTLSSDPSRCVWFPRLYETKTWDNELTPDGEMIFERKKNQKGGYEKVSYKEKWKSRIVCARYSDSLGAVLYRFVGVFKQDPDLSDKFKTVFVRVSDKVDTIAANNIQAD